VRDRPVGIGERELTLALADRWQINAVDTKYFPVGGGSYHWMVRDGRARQWFATADDLDDKHWLGHDRPTVATGLRAAMQTAFALRHDAGLRFVVSPVPSVGGELLVPLSPRYVLAVFPFLHGVSGRFDEQPSAEDRWQLIEMLVRLHAVPPAVAPVRHIAITVPRRPVLEAALREHGEPWPGGPFSEPARALIRSTGEKIRRLMGSFEQLAQRVTALDSVITHGEPHPANFIWTVTDTMLIDWDTVGLAPPERDLWMVATDSGEELRRYSRATGREVDPDALALYRIRWTLDDISAAVKLLRAAHQRTATTERAWLSLNNILGRLV